MVDLPPWAQALLLVALFVFIAWRIKRSPAIVDCTLCQVRGCDQDATHRVHGLPLCALHAHEIYQLPH